MMRRFHQSWKKFLKDTTDFAGSLPRCIQGVQVAAMMSSMMGTGVILFAFFEPQTKEFGVRG